MNFYEEYKVHQNQIDALAAEWKADINSIHVPNAEGHMLAKIFKAIYERNKTITDVVFMGDTGRVEQFIIENWPRFVSTHLA
jgi:hypothetical protein